METKWITTFLQFCGIPFLIAGPPSVTGAPQEQGPQEIQGFPQTDPGGQHILDQI